MFNFNEFIPKINPFRSEEVIFEYYPSELSDPKICHLEKRHMKVLKELSDIPNPITANKLNKISSVPSADRRVNELYHLWYVDSEKHENYFLYSINEKWKKLLESYKEN